MLGLSHCYGWVENLALSSDKWVQWVFFGDVSALSTVSGTADYPVRFRNTLKESDDAIGFWIDVYVFNDPLFWKINDPLFWKILSPGCLCNNLSCKKRKNCIEVVEIGPFLGSYVLVSRCWFLPPQSPISCSFHDLLLPIHQIRCYLIPCLTF